VDEQTRGNNILDLAFVSEPSFVEDYRIDEPFGMSDHKSVVLSVRFPVSRFIPSPWLPMTFTRFDCLTWNETVYKIIISVLK
jgi:hypothetical protein